MSNAKNHAEMMLISRRVKSGHEAAFERLMTDFIATAAGFPGCLGAQLVHPGDEPDVADNLHHALLAFENADRLQAWQASPERAAGLAAIAPHVEGREVVRGISGLAHWFQPPGDALPAQPPRWKVAVVTWLGIFPTVYGLFFLLGDILAPLPLLPRIFVLTVLVVALMTWVVAPRLTRLFKPWLYSASAPKP